MKKLVAESLNEFDETNYEEGEDGTLYNKEESGESEEKPKPKKRKRAKLSYDEKEARKRNRSFSGGHESDSWRGPNPNNH